MPGAFKAWMLNRRAASARSRPERVLQTLAVREGERVLDYGAGGGYFSLRFAELVGPEGRVFAVDINPSFLKYIEKHAAKRGLRNVQTLLVGEAAASVPEGSLDLVFMRNVTHHIEDRPALFAELRRLLRPGGRVALIEHLPGRGHHPPGHSVPPERLVSEMESAGLVPTHPYDFLPEQSLTIFIRRAARE
ncbi:MAG: class I SAM-dependent methyltransferase [Thermoplasmatota archaeon]